jgi:hypothetical protein
VDDAYLLYLDRDKLILGEYVELTDRCGRKRKMTERDLVEIRLQAAKKNGNYQAIASLQLET